MCACHGCAHDDIDSIAKRAELWRYAVPRMPSHDDCIFHADRCPHTACAVHHLVVMDRLTHVHCDGAEIRHVFGQSPGQRAL